MVPDFSIVYPVLWTDTSANEICAMLNKLDAVDLRTKQTELVIVVCHPNMTEIPNFDFVKKSTQHHEYTVRVYKTQGDNLEEGEALGSWLAFGHTLIIPYRHNPLTDNVLAMYAPFSGIFLDNDVKNVCDGNVYMFDSDGCWAITKRTYWDSCIYRMRNEWPESVTVYQKNQHHPDDHTTGGTHDGKPEKSVGTQDTPILINNLLQRSPLPFEESFISYEYRQWKWRHECTVPAKKMKPYAIYSTVYGYNDPICHEITRMVDKNADSLFFTDVKWPRHYRGWTVVYMPNIFIFQKTCRDPHQTMSRITKLMPYEFLNMYAATLYIDNNIIIKHTVTILIRNMLRKKEWGVTRHGKRNCAYKEIKKCIEIKKDDPKYLHMQEVAYRRAGLPRFAGQAECPVISRVNARRVAGICRQWWSETNKYSKRDQISFTFVAWKNKYWNHMNLLNSSILSKTDNSVCWVYKGGKCGKKGVKTVASSHIHPTSSVRYDLGIIDRITKLKNNIRNNSSLKSNAAIMKILNKLR